MPSPIDTLPSVVLWIPCLRILRHRLSVECVSDMSMFSLKVIDSVPIHGLYIVSLVLLSFCLFVLFLLVKGSKTERHPSLREMSLVFRPLYEVLGFNKLVY